MGDVGEGARFDFAVIPVGLTEEDGGRGVAIGHGSHVHAYIISQTNYTYKLNYNILHAYVIRQKNVFTNQNKQLPLNRSKNFGLEIPCFLHMLSWWPATNLA